MKKFDEESASPDELWDYCMKEYKSSNFISKYLISNFYSCLEQEIITCSNSSSVLEVGCGVAESSNRIYEMLKGSACFEASEYDWRYVTKLKELNLPYQVSVENVYELNRQDGAFDSVVMLEVLEHLTDYRKALKELFRVAKENVIISVPNEPLWRILNMARLKYIPALGNTPGHINHWSPSGLSELIGEFGTVYKVITPLPWTIIWAKKI